MSESVLGQAQGYLDHLSVERGASANTMSAYRRDLDRYCAFLDTAGLTDLAAVGESDVEAFRAGLVTGDPDTGRRPLAASSVARTMAAVRGLHRFATRDGLTPTDAAAGVRPPRWVGSAPFAHVPYRLGSVPIFVERVVDVAHDLGVRVVTWTVDDAPTMHALLDAGVDAVITDRPDVLRAVLVGRGRWWPMPARAGDGPAATSVATGPTG